MRDRILRRLTRVPVIVACSHHAARGTMLKMMRRLGTGLLAAGVTCLLILPWAFPTLLALAARHLSRDGNVTSRGATSFLIALILSGAGLMAAGFLARLLARGSVTDNLHRVFGDERTAERTYYTFTLSLLLGILLAVCVLAVDNHLEAGALETVQVLVLLVAAYILLRVVTMAGIRSFRGAVHALLAIAAFVVAGEEVSWGQTYIRWQTPNAWSAINVQHETNVHNLFNPWFALAHAIAALIIVLQLVGSAFMLAARRNAKAPAWAFLRPNLSGLVAVFVISLLLGALDRWSGWFELHELYAYLLLLLWATANMKRESAALVGSQEVDDGRSSGHAHV